MLISSETQPTESKEIAQESDSKDSNSKPAEKQKDTACGFFNTYFAIVNKEKRAASDDFDNDFSISLDSEKTDKEEAKGEVEGRKFYS